MAGTALPPPSLEIEDGDVLQRLLTLHTELALRNIKVSDLPDEIRSSIHSVQQAITELPTEVMALIAPGSLNVEKVRASDTRPWIRLDVNINTPGHFFVNWTPCRPRPHLPPWEPISTSITQRMREWRIDPADTDYNNSAPFGLPDRGRFRGRDEGDLVKLLHIGMLPRIVPWMIKGDNNRVISDHLVCIAAAFPYAIARAVDPYVNVRLRRVVEIGKPRYEGGVLGFTYADFEEREHAAMREFWLGFEARFGVAIPEFLALTKSQTPGDVAKHLNMDRAAKTIRASDIDESAQLLRSILMDHGLWPDGPIPS